MDIYDTWGSLIFSETGTTLRGWDGTVNGKDAENGNYYYKMEGTTFYGHTVNQEGPLLLAK